MKYPRRLWLALAIAAVIIAVHSVIFYYLSSHMAASTAVIVGVFVLVALKHLPRRRNLWVTENGRRVPGKLGPVTRWDRLPDGEVLAFVPSQLPFEPGPLR